MLVARDANEYRGPLEGLATGLRALADRADAVYATACDVPLLVPAFVERMFELLGDFDIAVPFDGQYHHPLAAVYRPTSTHTRRAASRIATNAAAVPVRRSDERVKCPSTSCVTSIQQLSTLENLNYEEDYFAALSAAGYTAPSDAQQ